MYKICHGCEKTSVPSSLDDDGDDENDGLKLLSSLGSDGQNEDSEDECYFELL